MTNGGIRQIMATPSMQRLKKIRAAIRSGEPWQTWPDMENRGPCGTRPGDWFVYANEWVIKQAMGFGRYYYSEGSRFCANAAKDGLTIEQCKSIKPPKKVVRKYGVEIVKPMVFVKTSNKNPMEDDITWMIQPLVDIIGDSEWDTVERSPCYSRDSALDLHSKNIGYDWRGRLVAIDW